MSAKEHNRPLAGFFMYRGRFAPSPSGPLHFGSLIAALGSYLDARSRNGEWLLRMDDLDPPREVPGAADDILRTLEAFGLQWDGTVMYQSHRQAAYQAALGQLQQEKRVFPCGCTRRETGPVYPGTCRNGLPAGREQRSVRLRVTDEAIAFTDRLQGDISISLVTLSGDFVIRRADDLFAYHLACAVDDHAQGITDVVRGADLLDASCNQIWLQQQLHYLVPRYLHLPVAVNTRGDKLSKKTQAPALNAAHAAQTLVAALEFLGQQTDSCMGTAQVEEILAAATLSWDPARIPAATQILV